MDPTFHGFQGKVEEWHWWYAVRREILDQIVGGLGLDPSRARLLDIGCGTGGMSFVLSRYGQAIALDRSPSSFSEGHDRPYTHRIVAAADRPLPFADATFDVICALDILEHLADDDAAVRELTRVLKPGGTLIAFVPAFEILWGENDEYSHHLRRYRKGDLARCLSQAGLAVEEQGYFNMVLFFPTLAVRLVQRLTKRNIGHAIEYRDQPTALNGVLRKIFALELPLLSRRRGGMPLGTSAFCVARRL
jgi:SAM-dependent methyltransferase